MTFLCTSASLVLSSTLPCRWYGMAGAVSLGRVSQLPESTSRPLPIRCICTCPTIAAWLESTDSTTSTFFLGRVAGLPWPEPPCLPPDAAASGEGDLEPNPLVHLMLSVLFTMLLKRVRGAQLFTSITGALSSPPSPDLTADARKMVDLMPPNRPVFLLIGNVTSIKSIKRGRDVGNGGPPTHEDTADELDARIDSTARRRRIEWRREMRARVSGLVWENIER